MQLSRLARRAIESKISTQGWRRSSSCPEQCQADEWNTPWTDAITYASTASLLRIDGAATGGTSADTQTWIVAQPVSTAATFTTTINITSGNSAATNIWAAADSRPGCRRSRPA